MYHGYKNYEESYVDAIAKELDRLEEEQLDTDGITLSGKVHSISHLTLPGDIECIHVKSSLVVSHVGAIIAIMTYSVGEDGTDLTLITDHLYDQLSQTGKDFILAHETGHIVLGHIGTASEANGAIASATEMDGLIQKTRNIQREFEADAFAVSVLGKDKVLNAMKEMHRFMRANPWVEFDFGELDRRIKKVKNGA